MIKTMHIPEKYLNMTHEQLENRVLEVKNILKDELFIPAHHYQKDEVVKFADVTGDSLELARFSKENHAKYIVFCGVHFMAETADMLTTDDQIVLLPDLKAGCSMADMANIHQVEACYDKLLSDYGIQALPLTYVNSTAAIKAFIGKYGGACLTSGNAHKMVDWALNTGEVILFLPDQHLGRNTAYDLGIPLEQMAIYNPITESLEVDDNTDVSQLRVILWKGHCSVHEKFTVQNIENIRASEPDRKIIVHPECTHEVVQKSDDNGSTRKIIETIKKAPAGSKWAIGTEMNLVNRLIQEHNDKDIVSLNPIMCPCLTMNRIDLPHFVWCLDKILEEDYHNQISVDSETTHFALVALERMLERQ